MAGTLMGWNNPPMPWAEFERKLSGGTRRTGCARRQRPVPRSSRRQHAGARLPTPAAEPHATARCPTPSCTPTPTSASSTAPPPPRNCSRSRSGSGCTRLAITDHDGFYGIVRMAEAAESNTTIADGVRRRAVARPRRAAERRRRPGGQPLLVLARGEEGYHRLAARAHRRAAGRRREGPPGLRPRRAGRARPAGQWSVLTGCRKGAVRQALARRGTRMPPTAARRRARGRRLVDLFGARPGARRADRPRATRSTPPTTTRWPRIAAAPALPTVATNNVHYATPARARAGRRAGRGARPAEPGRDGRLAAGIRRRAPAQRARRWPPGSPATPARSSARSSWPTSSAFELRAARPGLPKQEVPDGHTPMSWLRELVWRGAADASTRR